jgi:hypothetical protein
MKFSNLKVSPRYKSLLTLIIGLAVLLFAAGASAATNAASIESQSFTSIKIKPGAAFTFTLKYKNTGERAWNKENVYLKSLSTALKFRHSFWPDPYLPAQLKESSVAPGGVGTFVFALQAPGNLGSYTGEFVLVNDNVLISGGEAAVTMRVVEDPSVPDEPVIKPTPVVDNNPISTGNYCSLNLRVATVGGNNSSCVEKFSLPENGPDIRVGLFYTDKAITVKNTLSWDILNSNGVSLATIPANNEIMFFYNNATGEYSADLLDHTLRTTSYLTLKNTTSGMFTITSYHDIPSYSPKTDFNDFIGDLEIRHNDTYDRTWVIETLPLETYLVGMQEVRNQDSMEYLKSMVTAARTYAMYLYDRNTKHVNEFFNVDADYDQVYKGYVSMMFMPRVAEAAIATRGIVATYDNKVIVAAYFAHSDGRTRSFEEVWNNDVPYLVSKDAPYCVGKTLYGHGVGIDGYDARERVSRDNWTYDQVLTYYYSGIKLEKIY